MGRRRLERRLVHRKVRQADEPAIAAVDAADRQNTVVAAEQATAQIVQAAAQGILAVKSALPWSTPS